MPEVDFSQISYTLSDAAQVSISQVISNLTSLQAAEKPTEDEQPAEAESAADVAAKQQAADLQAAERQASEGQLAAMMEQAGGGAVPSSQVASMRVETNAVAASVSAAKPPIPAFAKAPGQVHQEPEVSLGSDPSHRARQPWAEAGRAGRAGSSPCRLRPGRSCRSLPGRSAPAPPPSGRSLRGTQATQTVQTRADDLCLHAGQPRTSRRAGSTVGCRNSKPSSSSRRGISR